MIYFEDGVARFNIKEFDEAEQSFSNAIAYNSKVSIYYAYRGQARLILENFEMASEVRDFATLGRGRLPISHAAPLLRWFLGDDLGNLQDFRAAVKLDPCNETVKSMAAQVQITPEEMDQVRPLPPLVLALFRSQKPAPWRPKLNTLTSTNRAIPRPATTVRLNTPGCDFSASMLITPCERLQISKPYLPVLSASQRVKQQQLKLSQTFSDCGKFEGGTSWIVTRKQPRPTKPAHSQSVKRQFTRSQSLSTLRSKSQSLHSQSVRSLRSSGAQSVPFLALAPL